MIKVKFIGLKNISLEITGNTLLDVLNVQRDEKFQSFTPIAIIVPSGSILYYDENKVNEFVNSDLTLKEFVQSCQCLGLYRNTSEIKTLESNFIESGCLWKDVGENTLVLINDELYSEYKFNPTEFEKII